MIDTDRLDPGHPHDGLDDTIDIEWVDRAQALAGLLRVSVRPSIGSTWFLAVVHQRGEDPVVVLDWELPVVSHAFEFRAPGIWTDFVCETPVEQWTIGLEAFGLGVDAADILTPEMYGDRTPVGLDLDVEAATAPDEHDDGFAHDVTVRGEVLVGSDAWEIDAVGVRRRRWDGRWPRLGSLTPGFDPQTRIAVQWPGQPSPEIRGWIMSNRPGWVELP
ncbi:MAG: hypothetical protein AAGC53_01165 [Actinomycetota bacterium]